MQERTSAFERAVGVSDADPALAPPDVTEIGNVVFTKFGDPTTLHTLRVATAVLVNVTSVTPVPMVTCPVPVDGFGSDDAPALLTTAIDVTAKPLGTLSATVTVDPTGNVPSSAQPPAGTVYVAVAPLGPVAVSVNIVIAVTPGPAALQSLS